MASMLASTLMLCGLMSSIFPFSSAASESQIVTSTVPPPIPLAVAKANNPYYNNPYYNNPYYSSQYYKPNPVGPVVPILSYSSEHVGDGSYAFSFATGDGKQAQESGFLKDAYIDNAGNPQGTQVVQGSYSYVSPEGTPMQVSYVADENGFRPSGIHIPADGKSIAQLPVVDGKDRPFDPLYSYKGYNPLYRNPYGPYNRPYDPRYPYDPTKYIDRYNPYRGAVQIKENKKEAV